MIFIYLSCHYCDFNWRHTYFSSQYNTPFYYLIHMLNIANFIWTERTKYRNTYFLSFFTFPGWLVSLKDTHFAYPLLRQSQISFKIYLRFIVLYATQYVAYLHSFMARLFLQTEWRFEPRTWRSRHWPSSFTIAFLFTRPKTDEYTTDFNVIGL